MGVLLGLAFGLGLVLIWSAFAVPAARRRSRGPGTLRRLLDQAGLVGVSVRGLVLLCGVLAVVAALVIQVVSGTTPVAVAFGVLAAYLPPAVVKGRARRRLRELAEVWPEAVDNLASASGRDMPARTALAGLATRGPEPLRPAFRSFALDYQASGRFGEALDRLKATLADPVGDRVVEGLRIAREVGGGDLGRLLRNLSGYLRDDLRTRSELESRQAWTVNGARLAVAAPWLVLFLLCFQPEVISRYSSPGGVVVLVGGAISCLVAYRLMVRLGRLPTDRRILA